LAASLLERGESSSQTTFDFTTIDVPGASTTLALDINNEGVIVGRYASAGRTHGFVRSTAGELTTIDFPGAGFTVAGALNNHGDIVGWYTLPAAPAVRHGFLLRDGEFTTFDPPGSIFTNVLGINDRGEIVGHFCSLAICLPFPGNGDFHGFLLREGEFTTIDFPGSHETNVFKINDRGQILGGYGAPDGNELPFVLRKGKFTSIALPGAKQISQDNGGLNDRGDIVGIYCDGAPPCFIGPTGTHGYVLSANDFATIDVPGALATTAVGINTRGEIVGFSFDASGSGHGYLLRWGHLGVIAASRDANDDGEDFPRAGTFHAEKNCDQYSGLADGFCTITVSTLKQIPVGTKVVYASPATATAVSSDLILVSPNPGNNVAFGHVELNRVTRTGNLSFSGGTGKFQHFTASVVITYLSGRNWAWDATYSFSDEGDRDDKD
jgi:uncharacterized membrane protein